MDIHKNMCPILKILRAATAVYRNKYQFNINYFLLKKQIKSSLLSLKILELYPLLYTAVKKLTKNILFHFQVLNYS